MISPEEAWNILQKSVKPLKTIRRAVSLSRGYSLARSIVSPVSLPPFDQSAMDGFALRHTDARNKLGVFTIMGTIAAGDTKRKKPPGPMHAYRIFTGACVPRGADAVVVKENVMEKDGGFIICGNPPEAGANIRFAGEYIQKGKPVLEKGHCITAGTIGYLSGSGILEVAVHSKPRVSVIVTGDELVKPGKKLKKGQVYESNSFSLQSVLESCGIKPVSLIHVRDRKNDVEKAIKSALKKSDLLILTGGISAGDFDYVKTALPACGVRDLFYKIAQKPGKPVYFGKKGNSAVFALPGNPAAVLSCFYEYVYPSIRMMMGFVIPFPEKRFLPLLSSYKKKPGISLFLKGRTEPGSVRPLEGQESYMLKSFAEADCLIYLPAGIQEVKKGTIVETHMLPCL